MAKVTISIVAYNGREYIKDCLESLKAQTFQDFEVFVIDNASSDGTLEEVSRIYPEAYTIPLPKNVGFGAAHNISIGASKSEWILVLNQDAVLNSDCLEKMLHNKDYAAIGPLLKRPDGSIDTAGMRKSLYGKVQDITVKTEPKEVWGISAACVLYSRDALQKIAYKHANRDLPEYFDEYFFMYKEDVDLAARLRKFGYKAWLESNAIGIHDRTTALSRSKRPEYIRFNSYKNHWLYLIKNARFLELPAIFIYETGKFFYLLIKEPKTLLSVRDVFRLIPVMIKRRYV